MSKQAQLQTIIEEQGITKSGMHPLIEAFGAPFTEAGEVLADYESIKVKDELDLATMAKAREARLILKKARTTVENNRKELKADIVKQGKAIDNIARFVKEQIEPAEKYLETQEKYAELKAAARQAEIKAKRVEQLSQYVDDISIFNLDEMTDERFEVVLESAKSQKEAEIALEKKREEERLEAEHKEREEQERIRLENEKLRKEAEEREKAEKAEREKREKEEAKRLEAERKERERIQAEADAKLAAERAEREKLEAEKREREEAERKEREAKEAEEAAAKNAGDLEKLKRFSAAIEVIRREKMPVMSEKGNRAIVDLIDEKLGEIQKLIEGWK